MKVFLLVLLAVGLSGCSTLDRLGPACRIALAPNICEAIDVVSAVVKDTQDAVDAVKGDEVEEE